MQLHVCVCVFPPTSVAQIFGVGLLRQAVGGAFFSVRCHHITAEEGDVKGQ